MRERMMEVGRQDADEWRGNRVREGSVGRGGKPFTFPPPDDRRVESRPRDITVITAGDSLDFPAWLGGG